MSCYDAQDDLRKCCNSCQELKEAYASKGLASDRIAKTAPQCTSFRGCRVHGKLTVNKVSGNVHVALGHSVVHEGKHLHQLDHYDVAEGFNTSHQIDAVSFGEYIPGLASPLDG